MWKRLKGWFFGWRKTSASGARDSFEPLDPAKVADELGPENMGFYDGGKNNPPSSANSFGGSEQKIIHYFQQEAIAAHGITDNRLRDLENAQEKKKLSVEESYIKSLVKTLQSNAQATLANARTQMEQLHSTENELSKEYHDFRQRNRLSRSANYPDSWWFLIAVMASILMIEAMLNGYFFAKANEFGLVGGVSQAVITAGINIAFSWMLGWLVLRQWNHEHIGRRLVGWMGLGLFFVWMFGYNLFIGHYRDAIAASMEGDLPVVADVGQMFVDNPLSLSGESWLLMAMGAFFAVIALLDGYNFDDPYPGYGTLARRLEEARDDYQETLSEIRLELGEHKEALLVGLQNTSRDIDKRHRIINDWDTASGISYKNFVGYFDDLNALCKSILQQYRDANISSRKDDPPVYFSEPFDLGERVTLDLRSPKQDGYMQHEKERLKSLANSVHKVENEINRAYTKIVEDLNGQIQDIEG